MLASVHPPSCPIHNGNSEADGADVADDADNVEYADNVDDAGTADDADTAYDADDADVSDECNQVPDVYRSAELPIGAQMIIADNHT